MAWGVIPFLLGFSGLALYVALRFFEVRREQRVFEGLRALLDRITIRLYRLLVFGELPASYRASVASAFRSGVHSSAVFLVSLLRAIERPLARLSHRMRRSTREAQEPPRPSDYLKTIMPERGSDSEASNTPL